MVLNEEYMNYLYNNEVLLEYLRYHPKWYKILYYDPNMFKSFLTQAKTDLKITAVDRLQNFQNKVNMISNLADYIGKKE